MKKRILIADNSEEFCHQLVLSLQKYDEVEVIGTVHDGEQTVLMVKQQKPDMLVLDLLLPKLDGIGVLKEIYSMENRPVVVATSRFITDYVASSVACLEARYLMLKPCDMTSLTEQIVGHWSENELQRRPRESTANKIENLVTDILHDIGVPAHIKGYQYLREALIVAVKDIDVINALAKVLYPQIARTFQTTPARVARAIQYAIEVVWNRRNQNTLDQFFGTAVSKREDKPTIAEFLTVIADDIQCSMRML